MLQRLGLPISAVIGFSVLSQAFNVIFIRVWGRFTDQFSNKAVLSVCVSLYLLVILGWTFTTMPERYLLTIPLLVILHMLAGIAAAGVTLSTSTIGMKLAPEGKATAYLAGAGLAISIGSGIGPLLGGRFADFFSMREFSLTFTWIDPGGIFDIGALYLTGFDFLFGISFILGLITLGFLASVREEGEGGREVILEALYSPVREMSRPLSTMAGLGFLSHFPYGYLRRVPMPGVDVALGVTAYQIAEIGKVTTIAVAKGKGTAARLSKALGEGLSKVIGSNEITRKYGSEIARHAVRGSIHGSVEDAQIDIGKATHQAVLGVVLALQQSQINPREALRGAGQGIIQGTYEIKADIGQAVLNAVEAAAEFAPDAGLSEKDASEQIKKGIFEAAKSLGPEAISQLPASLYD
jgi:MFS family permease